MPVYVLNSSNLDSTAEQLPEKHTMRIMSNPFFPKAYNDLPWNR